MPASLRPVVAMDLRRVYQRLATRDRAKLMAEPLPRRQVGQASFFLIGEKLRFLATGTIIYYEFIPEEYRQRAPFMKRCTLKISNFTPQTADN